MRFIGRTSQASSRPDKQHGLGQGLPPGAIRLVVLNPAHSEFQVLHPERRVKAAEAERAQRCAAGPRGGRRRSCDRLRVGSARPDAREQPHSSALGEEGSAPSCSGTPLNQAKATQHVAKHFPAASGANYKKITQDAMRLVAS